jgi:hypothetical protein
MPLMIAALLTGCPNGTDNNSGGPGDTRTTLTAAGAVTAAAAATTGTAAFTGAAGLALAAADFTVTGEGGAIGQVTVDQDTVNVVVSFAANESFTEAKSFTVGISPDSTLIKGTGTVTITQSAKAKLELTAGSAVSVEADAVTATVTFTGAAGLTTLAAADFTVTTGGTISGVMVNNGTASVTVTFAANTSETETKTYTVGIASNSATITGSATVVITQNKVLPQIVLPDATTSVAQDYEGDSTTNSWTIVTGMGGNSAANITQALVADPAGGASKVGSYNGTGNGNRGTTLNLTEAITGDTVVAEFDWYPGTYPGSGSNQKGPLYISLNDAVSTYTPPPVSGNGTHTHGNRIITFINDQAGTLKYRLGHFDEIDEGGNTVDPLAGAVEIPDTTGKTQWYTVQVIFDFTAGKINRLTVKDKAAGAALFTASDLAITGTGVAAMRLFLIRTNNGHTTYLDNVFIGNGKRPQQP